MGDANYWVAYDHRRAPLGPRVEAASFSTLRLRTGRSEPRPERLSRQLLRELLVAFEA